MLTCQPRRSVHSALVRFLCIHVSNWRRSAIALSLFLALAFGMTCLDLSAQRSQYIPSNANFKHISFRNTNYNSFILSSFICIPSSSCIANWCIFVYIVLVCTQLWRLHHMDSFSTTLVSCEAYWACHYVGKCIIQILLLFWIKTLVIRRYVQSGHYKTMETFRMKQYKHLWNFRKKQNTKGHIIITTQYNSKY